MQGYVYKPQPVQGNYSSPLAEFIIVSIIVVLFFIFGLAQFIYSIPKNTFHESTAYVNYR